jgi:3-hydroxybutyryl-CoA dehydrogenase
MKGEGDRMSIRTVGVLGAGVMGTGVAHALAETGHRVILVDLGEEQLQGARRNIDRNLRLYRLMKPAPPGAPEPREVLARIEGTSELARLGEVDFLVENITEKWELKQELYGRLGELGRPELPIGVNTSAIPMARFAARYAHPRRIVGMHFMNPVPLMPVVEVVRGEATGEDTLDAAKTLVSQMGRQCIVVKDSPGFVTNRVMMLTVNEAIFLLQEGVSTAPDIDRLFQTCFHHRMGPLATADLIGLDTVLYSLEVLHRELGDDKFRPCPLLQQMVSQGHLGLKSGQGFFHYEDR